MSYEVSRVPTVPRQVGTKKIVYPQFKSCMSFTQDPEWIEILERASWGKFDPKVSYNAATNTIMFRVGSKTTKVDLPSDPQEMWETLLKFYHNVCKKKSKEDRINDRARQDSQVLETTKTPTVKINYKMLNHFVMRHQKKFGWSEQVTQEVLSKLIFWSYNSSIEKNNFSIEGDTLVSIKELILTETGCEYSGKLKTIKKYTPGIDDCNHVRPDGWNLMKGWTKFIKVFYE